MYTFFLAHCPRPSFSHGHLIPFNQTTFNVYENFCTDADDECIAGSLAVFECDPGYIISGYGYSTCQGRGEWYPPVPTCIGKHLYDFESKANSEKK